MAYTYLEFEKPISDLENKIEKLRLSGGIEKDIESETSKLSSQIEKLTKEIYSNLSIWQKVKIFFQILMSFTGIESLAKTKRLLED